MTQKSGEDANKGIKKEHPLRRDWSIKTGKDRNLINNKTSTLRFLINVLDQISVLVGNFVKFNKRTGPNKHTGAKLLPQKCNFS